MTITPDELPYSTPAGARLDSGSHLEAFEWAIGRTREVRDEARAAWSHDDRVRVGMGVASYVEGVAPTYFGTSGNWTSQDAAVLRFDPGGGLTVAVGVITAGQGLRTMVATLVSEELQVPIDDVRVVIGDSDLAPYGLGGWGSRSTIVAGGAIALAAEELRGKAVRLAAHLLEAAPEDVELVDGRFRARGAPDVSMGWGDVATAALVRTMDLPRELDPGLEASATYDLDVDHVPDARGLMNACATYTNATHGVVVKVDIGTGAIEVLRYLVAHDCGTVINPTIVEGQIAGGVAQGIGGTLLEDLVYADGQPLAASFMDYLLPSSDVMPPVEIKHFESPAPGTVFGAKGAGEAGIIGPAPAIAAAVEDALAEFGIPEITTTPITNADVLDLIERGRAGGGDGSA
jgi:carbon-monoxide dehydrogenase large subunit